MKARILAVVAIAMLGVGAYFVFTRFVAQRALEKARAGFRVEDWQTARSELRSYLKVFPANDEARLRLAEAFFKDPALNSERAVTSALEQLELVRRESSYWPAARVQVARMFLFARLQPFRAESVLRELLAAEPSNVDVNYVLWKLHDLTGRSHLAEPFFRAVLDATPLEDRPVRLREWYMSQFYPAMANPEIDEMMGFLEPGAIPNGVTELRRLESFRDREPRAALNHASVARWYSLEGDPKTALQLLQKALDATDAPLQEPFFVSTLVQVLFDLGEFDKSLKHYRAWPGEPSGYEHLRLGAILADDVERDFERAIRGYRQVSSEWPGPAEWRIQFRLAHCLAKTGDETAAESTRKQAKAVELLMEEDVHNPLRRLLEHPDQLEVCQRMTQFYEQLGVQFETQQWQKQVDRLKQESDRAARPETP